MTRDFQDVMKRIVETSRMKVCASVLLAPEGDVSTACMIVGGEVSGVAPPLCPRCGEPMRHLASAKPVGAASDRRHEGVFDCVACPGERTTIAWYPSLKRVVEGPERARAAAKAADKAAGVPRAAVGSIALMADAGFQSFVILDATRAMERASVAIELPAERVIVDDMLSRASARDEKVIAREFGGNGEGFAWIGANRAMVQCDLLDEDIKIDFQPR